MAQSFIYHPNGTKFYAMKTETKFIICTGPNMQGALFQVDLKSCLTQIMVEAAGKEYTEADLKLLGEAVEIAQATVDAIKSVEAGH